MNTTQAKPPTTVSEVTKQVGETWTRDWGWVEASAWTDRMLETLVLNQGVEEYVWYSLIDKVWQKPNLEAALERVVKNAGAAGIDGMKTERLAKQRESIIEDLQQRLQSNRYHPQPAKRVWIDKPGSKEKRPLGIPVVVDRVVETALRNVMEPIFEAEFAAHSYGFRPGRGAQGALQRVEDLLAAGYHWTVDADIQGYFDNIPHDQLLERIGQKITDGRVLSLIRSFLERGVMESAKDWKPTINGTPQGAVISPLLANIYLDPLDHLMEHRGWRMTRFADDFVILCRSQAEAQEALDQIKTWVQEAGLTLHPTKTQIVDATQKGGFDFLGFHFERGMKWPRKKSLKKLKDAIRAKTRRTDGRSLETIVADLNPTLQGWYGYFHDSHHTTFSSLDGWIRQRLRAILKKRNKRPGIPKGDDLQRWPIAFFNKLGVFRLTRDIQLKLPIPLGGF